MLREERERRLCYLLTRSSLDVRVGECIDVFAGLSYMLGKQIPAIVLMFRFGESSWCLGFQLRVVIQIRLGVEQSYVAEAERAGNLNARGYTR